MAFSVPQTRCGLAGRRCGRVCFLFRHRTARLTHPQPERASTPKFRAFASAYATARKLNLDPARVISTVADHANTSAASVPLALSTAVGDGRIKPGQLLVLEAMGGGFTWGACLVRW